MDNRLKIVWLCAYSDAELRKNLKQPKWYWGNIVRSMLGMKKDTDVARWDTNAITAYKKIGGIELHIINAHHGYPGVQEFDEDGIYYHIVWSEYDVIAEKIKRKFNKRNLNSFPHFRKDINRLINRIQPDLVHVIGIENKFHSMAVLDFPENLPVLSQLQTLVNDIRFKEGSGNTDMEYQYNSDIERRILLRTDYIGTMVSRFRELITKNVKPNAIYVDTTLPVTEEVCFEKKEKKYDFVYFAHSIRKAADWAIEAFIIASKQHPGLTLDIIGAYDEEYKAMLQKRLIEFGLVENVTFEGRLPTHEDVINQIRLSRFALLPLKIDIVSGTIRESMANGIPVITTITPGTPKLNEKNECVLISEPEDFQSMADNMLELVNNPAHADLIRQNALNLASERESNEQIISKWIETYKQILNR